MVCVRACTGDCLCAQQCPILCPTPWTIACHAPLFIEFSRQEHWNGSAFPAPGDLLHPGIEGASLGSPALARDSLLLNQRGTPQADGFLPVKMRGGDGRRHSGRPQTHLGLEQAFVVSQEKPRTETVRGKELVEGREELELNEGWSPGSSSQKEFKCLLEMSPTPYPLNQHILEA